VVNTGITLGKCKMQNHEVEVQQNFYIPQLQNYDAAKITCFTVVWDVGKY